MALKPRPLSLTTPLGRDVLLVAGFTGQESLSSLFRYELELFAPNDQEVPFDALLGQPMTVELAGRFFHGICNRFSAGSRGSALTAYRAEVVPWLWFLTRKSGSRIFQEVSVPDILRQTLQGGSVAFELQGNSFARDYCVQYRETDFDFVSRLMEEEGIWYVFRATADGHQMVVADTPASFTALPAVQFDASGRTQEPGIFQWEKTQELRSGRVTLWDSTFELPHNHLEAQAAIQESVQAGTVNHKLRLAVNDGLEQYDYPGGYAQRFDGVDPGGGDRPGELQKILPEGQRTAGIRMQQEAASSVAIEGASTVPGLASGLRFALRGHFDGDGAYVLTSVQHAARVNGDLRTATAKDLEYSNSFTCIPEALPFRPARRTPKPDAGAQTAFVVGPAGEEIFTDKYGRVKVQFHWDREGKNDQDSSCWVRVGALHAGGERTLGFHFLPEVGDEVIVAFEHGDIDQPIVIGSVWNAEKPPPPHLKDPPGGG